MKSLILNREKYKDMEYNSKKIKQGDIFVALEGVTVDGHNYINMAIENGAKGIIHSKEIDKKEGIDYYCIDNLREKLGEIASEFYGWPQKDIKIIGITGTNGKTTTTYLLEQLLGEEKVARVGTVEYKIGDEIIEAPNTTPESLDIVKMCKKIVQKKIPYLVMEVSSHALMLGRVDMLEFDVAIFSNLTPEHLDFHKNMNDYYLAKRNIFTKLKKVDNKVIGKPIINIDDEYGRKYYNEFKGLTYGIDSGKLHGKFVEGSRDCIEINYEEENKDTHKLVSKVKLLGRYNLYNILSAVGGVLALGYDWEYISSKLKHLTAAPGRFEIIDCRQKFTAVVDYAHSADALENLLKTVKDLEFSKIITIFGCGGDRDKTKRPVMTDVAIKHSDVVIITADNPRTEKIEDIIKDMVINIEKNSVIIEPDRENAIIRAVEMANDGEIIVVAGKGHEAYQILGKEKIHFDDREYLRREIIKKLKNKNN